jgi:RimK family alpha-L-glutamate ligase
VDDPNALWIVINLGLGPKFQDQARRHLIAFNQAGIDARVIDSCSLITTIGESISLTTVDGQSLQAPKVVMFGVKDVILGNALTQLGSVVLNAPESIALCDDKRSTQLALQHANVAMPASIFPPHLYPGQPRPEFLESAADRLGLPLIAKEVRGSFGRQVTLIPTIEALRDYVNQLGDRPYLLQEYIREAHGSDIRIQVVNGRWIAAITRQASGGQVQANLTLGSTGKAFKPDRVLAELAEHAANALGLVNAGVDIVLRNSGEPLVLEVNSNAHIARISEITGIDCAAAFASFVAREYFS